MTFLLALRALGSSALAFLGKLNIYQLGCIALALCLGVQTIRLHAEQRHAGKVETQLSKAVAELNKISTATQKAKADAASISKQLKDKNDEDNRRIAGDANSLRVSGPGKALCRAAPTAPGGREQAPAKPDAPRSALPSTDSAAVPWDWLTGRAEEHDRLLAEVEAWRAWHDEVLKVWPKN